MVAAVVDVDNAASDDDAVVVFVVVNSDGVGAVDNNDILLQFCNGKCTFLAVFFLVRKKASFLLNCSVVHRNVRVC